MQFVHVFSFQHEEPVVSKAKYIQRQESGQEHNHPGTLAVFCEDLEFEFSAEDPLVDNELANQQANKNSKQPTAKFEKNEGTSWPSAT